MGLDSQPEPELQEVDEDIPLEDDSDPDGKLDTPVTKKALERSTPPKPLGCQVSDDDTSMKEVELEGGDKEGEEESSTDDESRSPSGVPELPQKEMEHREKAFRLLSLTASWFLVVQSRFHGLT